MKQLTEAETTQQITTLIQQFHIDTRMLIEKLRVSIPAYSEEFLLMNIGDTVDTWKAYSTNIVRVTAIIVNTPTASTAVTLQLGNRIMPLPSGFVNMSPISFILRAEEVRKITLAPVLTVPAFVWVMGEQMPEYAF